MSDRDISHSNSQKLDQLIELVKGSENAPGMLGRLALVERVLFGQDNSGGLVTQHQTLWKIHRWLIGAVSAGLGAILTLLIQKFAKLL